MSGWQRGANRNVIGRRTPEGVAPGPVGQPIVTGATALGFATTTQGRFQSAALSTSSAFIPGRSS